jgi:negative regulator of flagellin synthesis FlgM
VKIDQSVNKNTGLPVTTSQTRTGKTAEKAGADKAADSDSVTLSPEAQAMAVVSDKDTFDMDKISQIKAAIANGTFKVNANRIADGLIDTVKDLISTRKG